MPLLRERVARVKEFRLASKKEATRQYAEKPYLFMERRQPSSTYLAVPSVTSETRKYIPLAFFEASIIANNRLHVLENASPIISGCFNPRCTWHGRGKCADGWVDFIYSSDLVYNNFAWPQDPRPQDVQAVSDAAQAVLDVRERYPQNSLADLYDPLAMPKDLLDAHRKLDRAVDRCYRREAFKADSERLRFLFERYAALTACKKVALSDRRSDGAHQALGDVAEDDACLYRWLSLRDPQIEERTSLCSDCESR